MTIKPIFAWYDIWVGAFWDAAKRRLYIFPVPMLGVVIQFATKGPKPRVKLRPVPMIQPKDESLGPFRRTP